MKIHLRRKKLKSGKISLYLEYYKGNSKTPEGKRKILRDFEYLDLYLFPNPETPEEKKKNKENLELADQIFTIRKAELYQGKYNIQNDKMDILVMLGSSSFLVKQIKRNLPIPFSLEAENQLYHTSFF